MNTAVGYASGTFVTSGSHNIYLGANVSGAAGDANTMRLGVPYNPTTQEGQTKTFIAGITGTQLTGPVVQVFVDANGQLGTLTAPPITGTIGQPLSADPRPDAALLAELREQRAVIADLRARLTALEAKVASPPAARTRRR